MLCGGFSGWRRRWGPLGAPPMPGASLGEAHEEACPGARPLQPARIPRNTHLFIVRCFLPYAPDRASAWFHPWGTLLRGWGVAGSSAGSPPPWDPPPCSAILTADDVSVGNVEVVGGYQGSALALSQLPVAAVVGMAAPAGDTVSNPWPRTLPHHTWKVKEGPASNLR